MTGATKGAMADLTEALDRLERPVALWWRDDDAVSDSPALARLLALAGRHRLPLALAVIPAEAEPSLAAALAPHPLVSVLQHGWSHADRSAPGQKRTELTERALADGLADLVAAGRRRLAALFGARALPVMTPPWNRVDPAVAALLGVWGYRAVSLMAGNPAPGSPPRIDCHVDPIDWRRGGGFIGVRRAVDQIVAALDTAARNTMGQTETTREATTTGNIVTRPVGLLTHHRVHDEALWAFLDTLLARLSAHPMIRWPEVPRLVDHGQV